MTKVLLNNHEFDIKDSDIVNPDDYDYTENIYLLHEHGFVLCIVNANNEGDALDIAADESKLDRFKADIEELNGISVKEFNNRAYSHLGNDCALYDTESIGIIQLPNLELSYIATLQKHLESKELSKI
jgi:hypothetical protein